MTHVRFSQMQRLYSSFYRVHYTYLYMKPQIRWNIISFRYLKAGKVGGLARKETDSTVLFVFNLNTLGAAVCCEDPCLDHQPIPLIKSTFYFCDLPGVLLTPTSRSPLLSFFLIFPCHGLYFVTLREGDLSPIVSLLPDIWPI